VATTWDLSTSMALDTGTLGKKNIFGSQLPRKVILHCHPILPDAETLSYLQAATSEKPRR